MKLSRCLNVISNRPEISVIENGGNDDSIDFVTSLVNNRNRLEPKTLTLLNGVLGLTETPDGGDNEKLPRALS